jgi:hypothetical protein
MGCVNEAGDARLPRGVTGLKRESPPWNLTRQIEQTVHMDEAGAVFIDPQHRSPIPARPLNRGREVI